MTMLFPSPYPSAFIPARKASKFAAFSFADIVSSMPMRRIRSARCAHAASGHVAATQPTRLINSRRFMAVSGTNAQDIRSIALGKGLPMSALAQKRTSAHVGAMSALLPRADKLLTKDEARRIAANIAKLSKLVRRSARNAQFLFDLGHHRARQARLAEFRKVFSEGLLP